jgi:hypothetical protein
MVLPAPGFLIDYHNKFQTARPIFTRQGSSELISGLLYFAPDLPARRESLVAHGSFTLYFQLNADNKFQLTLLMLYFNRGYLYRLLRKCYNQAN